MKELKAIGTLTLYLLLFTPKIIVYAMKVTEGAVRVIRNTITFLIESIEAEVLENKTLKPWEDQ